MRNNRKHENVLIPSTVYIFYQRRQRQSSLAVMPFFLWEVTAVPTLVLNSRVFRERLRLRLPSVFGRNSRREPIRKVDTREEWYWSHTSSLQASRRGNQRHPKCSFLSKNAHRTRGEAAVAVVLDAAPQAEAQSSPNTAGYVLGTETGVRKLHHKNIRFGLFLRRACPFCGMSNSFLRENLYTRSCTDCMGMYR
jgi:hypothetical protein